MGGISIIAGIKNSNNKTVTPFETVKEVVSTWDVAVVDEKIQFSSYKKGNYELQNETVIKNN